MLRLLFFAAFLQCTISQQYQQKVAPGVPPQNYQPPPPPQQQQPPPPPQQQQFQPPPVQEQPPQPQTYQDQPPPQQYQPPPPPQQYQQVPVQQQYQQVPMQQQQVPVQPVQQVNMQQQMPQQQQQQQGGHAHLGDPQLLNPANIAQERDHIQEHMEVPIDTSKMSEQELQFHYFKMHDADNNNKLDGCELIKSLIHWHGDEVKSPVHSSIYKDEDLIQIIDETMKKADKNNDGFIEYLEFKAVST